MIQPIIKRAKEYFRRKRDLKKSLAYYQAVQNGARFIEFIYSDLERHKGTLNRETRRRFESQLEKQGKLNAEMITHYASKVDQILAHIKGEIKKG